MGDGNEFDYGVSPVAFAGGSGNDPLPPVAASFYDTPAEAAVYNNPPGEWDWWNPALVEINRETVNGQRQLVYYLKYTEGGTARSFRHVTRDALVDQICDLSAAKCPAYNDAQDGNGDAYAVVNAGGYSGSTFFGPAMAGLTPETRPFRKRYYTRLLQDPSLGQSAAPGADPNVVADPGPARSWEERNQYTSNGVTANFSFDPNRFLSENEKVRISAWLEY